MSRRGTEEKNERDDDRQALTSDILGDLTRSVDSTETRQRRESVLGGQNSRERRGRREKRTHLNPWFGAAFLENYER